MSITREDLKTSVAGLLKVATDDWGIYSEDLVNSALNMESLNIYNLLVNKGWSPKISTEEYTAITDAVADTNNMKYTLPSDYFSFERCKWVIDDIEHPIVDRPGFQKKYNNLITGRPVICDIEEDELIVDPPPHTTGIIRLKYIPSYTDYVDDDSVMPFSDNYKNAPIYYAVIQSRKGFKEDEKIRQEDEYMLRSIRRSIRYNASRGLKPRRKMYVFR